MAKIMISSDCGLDGLTFHLPSKVQPQFARDSDIGIVVQRFLKSGQLPAMIDKPTIEDANTLPGDFSELMEQNIAVRQRFEMLPAEDREKFNNSCDNWLAYLADEAVKTKEVKDESKSTEPPVASPADEVQKVSEDKQ